MPNAKRLSELNANHSGKYDLVRKSAAERAKSTFQTYTNTKFNHAHMHKYPNNNVHSVNVRKN